jgi:DnaA family protein
MNEQLSLGLKLRDSARFSNFVAGANAELLHGLTRVASGEQAAQVFLHGAAGSGKSHLLQASCQRASSTRRSAAYLSLAEARAWSTDLLTGWEQYDLVCIDDVDAAAGLPDWQEALFHLYNRLKESGGSLVASALMAPAALPFDLPDLVSRFGAGLVYQLQRLDESQSLQALCLRARQRGFELPDETGRYLLKRVPRDLPALMGLLDRLDTASLEAQRRLTVPFVKTVLDL